VGAVSARASTNAGLSVAALIAVDAAIAAALDEGDATAAAKGGVRVAADLADRASSVAIAPVAIVLVETARRVVRENVQVDSALVARVLLAVTIAADVMGVAMAVGKVVSGADVMAVVAMTGAGVRRGRPKSVARLGIGRCGNGPRVDRNGPSVRSV